MVKKWVGFSLLCLSGCVSAGLFSQGENAVYSFKNNSDDEIGNVQTIGFIQTEKRDILTAHQGLFPSGDMFLSANLLLGMAVGIK